MKKIWIVSLPLLLMLTIAIAQREKRTTINLNGIWKFDQTTKSFPPKKYTRKIPVPGLVYLAEPKIEDYDKKF